MRAVNEIWSLPFTLLRYAKVCGGYITIAIIVFGAACAAPQYDEKTDRLISQLQTDVDMQIVSLITLRRKIDSLSKKNDRASKEALADAMIKAGYDANTSFYDKIDVDLTILQTRVDARQSLAAPYLDNSIKLLRDNLLAADGSMQITHQKVDILSESYLQLVKTLVDTQIAALLARELGLKKGASAANSSGSAPPSPSGAAARPADTK